MFFGQSNGIPPPTELPTIMHIEEQREFEICLPCLVLSFVIMVVRDCIFVTLCLVLTIGHYFNL